MIYRISGDPTRRDDVIAMAEWLNSQLKQVGVDTKLVDLGRQTVDGKDLPLPPAILGRVGNDVSKKTLLIYGHFDVQPVRSQLHFLNTEHKFDQDARQISQMAGTLSLSHLTSTKKQDNWLVEVAVTTRVQF